MFVRLCCHCIENSFPDSLKTLLSQYLILISTFKSFLFSRYEHIQHVTGRWCAIQIHTFLSFLLTYLHQEIRSPFNTSHNLKNLFHNIHPERMISFIHAIGLLCTLNFLGHDIAAICMFKMPLSLLHQQHCSRTDCH